MKNEKNKFSFRIELFLGVSVILLNWTWAGEGKKQNLSVSNQPAISAPAPLATNPSSPTTNPAPPATNPPPESSSSVVSPGGRTSSMDFEGDIIEGMNKNPFESITSLYKKDNNIQN